MDQQRMRQRPDFACHIISVTDSLRLALDQVKASINKTPFVCGNNAALLVMNEGQEQGPCNTHSAFLDSPKHVHDCFLVTLRHGLSTIRATYSAACSFIWRSVQEHARSTPDKNPSSPREYSVHDASQRCDQLGASQLHASLQDLSYFVNLLLMNSHRVRLQLDA